jgi:alginate O-acetyltransferase complex protein AlgI
VLFNSLQFALFFPVVTALFFALRPRRRQFLLVAASCWFYMAFVPAYLLIILALIAVDYGAAILIDRADGRRRRLYLALSIVANVGMLAWFKYLNFLLSNGALAWGLVTHQAPPSWHLDIILPIGLSFHTFQSMSYTIEVYRRRVPVTRDVVRYALYVLFYPQLVAGPIERPYHLLPQLGLEEPFDYDRVTSGLKLMAWGLFKKMVIADRLAMLVAPVYNAPEAYHGPVLAAATVAFAFQIFCDFSGYSDVAIGAAEVMGVRLVQNFNRPYSASSIAEFWQRWHISLSTWFRDYVYVPLGGNRVARPRWFVNLLVTFMVSGLWHGAKWTFVIWGALNGLYLIAGIVLAPARASLARLTGLVRTPRLAAALGTALTFLLICVAWVFFRANSVSDAVQIIGRIFGDGAGWRALATTPVRQWIPATVTGFHLRDAAIVAAAIGLMEAIHWVQRAGSVRALVSRQPIWVRWSLYYAICVAIIMLRPKAPQQFIYFQF